MLSQLCRAKPFWTLNPKIQQSRYPTASTCQTCINGNNRDQSLGEESRCQLIHCSYCDYRRCSLVNSCGNLEYREDLQSTESSFQVTENPAYGLSSKLWLECEVSEVPADIVNKKQGTEEQGESKESPLNTMSHVTVPSSCLLESIPESKEITTKQSNSSNQQEKSNKHTNKKDRHSWMNHKSDTAEKPEEVVSCDKYGMDTKHCDIPCDNPGEEFNQLSGQSVDVKVTNSKQRPNTKDKTFPLSLIKPHLKSSEVKQSEFTMSSLQPKTKHETSRLRKFPNNVKDKYMFGNSRQLRSSNVLGHDKLSEITSVKTEESIHEWLMRISDWVDSNSWIKDDDSAAEKVQSCAEDTTFPTESVETSVDSRSQTSGDQPNHEIKRDIFEDLLSEASTVSALSKATKESPANIPMVVMQCSRLHSHITSKPPFQQTSLPMGTLVTALYQESDWLYVQTPHGVEGFVTSSNCVPIGTVQGSSQPKRPWEPCDFPIQISIRNTCDFGQMHGTFVPAKLPTTGGKRPGPFVSMVKMKTNLYSDRYFNNTFKHKDSIKTAKTVTDILRSSPEMEVNKQ